MTLKIPFDIQNKNYFYIDVRSESEFAQGHIIGAINMPILSDEERHEVGTLYKQVSIEKAKRLGLQYASRKILDYFDLLSDLKAKNPQLTIVFYCARGGFRSRSITQLLQGIGEEVYCLEGGYKNYRNIVLDYLNSAENMPLFIMLHGFTGVGKTAILHNLSQKKIGVLDLEGAANHKGSHLGAIGTNCIQSQQIFENTIYHELSNLKTPYAFVESESKRIGSVFIPPLLFDHIRNGKHLLVNRSIQKRVESLVEEYCGSDNFDELIKPSLERIKPYLSNEIYSNLLQQLQDKDYDAFAETLLISHYDPIYNKSIKNYTYDLIFDAETNTQGVEALQNWLIEQNI